MTTWSRADTSLVGRWWWTVDRWFFSAVISLALIGVILTLAASPPVADRIGLDTFYFARRQIVFIAFALSVMVLVSFMSRRGVRRLALLVTFGAISLMIITLELFLKELTNS